MARHGLLKILATTVLLLEMSSTSSALLPEVQMTLTLPATWSAVSLGPDQPEGVGLWLSPKPRKDGFRQNVNLVRYAVPEPLESYVREALLFYKSHDPSLTYASPENNRRCGRGVSEIVEEQSVTPRGTKVAATQVFTENAGIVFIATYTRAYDDSIDPDAVNAIEGMCP